VSDERKRAKSKKVPDELHAEVADQLRVKPGEIAVFTNPDGVYAVDRNGHRMLLQETGEVAWYGDKAPNGAFPLVRPSVLVDESDVEETDGLAASTASAKAEKPEKPGPAPRASTAKK
jgi:hypothetical protein